MPFTHIIFDLGGVVLSDDWSSNDPAYLQEIAKALGSDPKAVDCVWGVAWQGFFRGFISEDVFWQTVSRLAQGKNPDIKQAKIVWRKYQHETERMLTLLSKLKANDYYLSCLTTNSKEWLDFKVKKFDLETFFGPIVSSADEVFCKIDPQIYKIMLDKLETLPENCIFIDDRQENLQLAQRFGIHTILFKNQTQLERELKKIGVNVNF